MTGRLERKVCVVTGAASGIGKATAEQFVSEGAQVYAIDVEGEAGTRDRFFHSRVFDVTDVQGWVSLISEIQAREGRVDILFNCAGLVGSYGTLTDISIEDWHRIIAVNQTGVFYGMRAVIPLMQRGGGGSIINMSSVWGLIGASGVAAYQASKGAVRLMTKNAAITYGGDGIRANSIHPGLITTPMTEAQDPAISAQLVAETPLGRPGLPSEVASAVVFLGSDESSYITGAELTIDGGLSCH